ncbi:hypothetical protein Tsubulata_006343 [Turnera subulata]|uniref:DUF659 domain-containing protein n=1 Tax=Turnera subulata TaxID=218843 RepID=A0A9Q0JJ53_9ROSI|nr:hypothetical protein Tsubulata_006343 [Turnera subulata]
MNCNYCGKVVTGLTRFKCHLGGVGTDVTHCMNISQDLRDTFKDLVLETKRENLARRADQQPHPATNLNDAVHLDGKVTQCSVGARKIAKEDLLSSEVVKCIGRFFYETGMDFSAVGSPSFQKLMNATLGDGHVECMIPSAQDLKGVILQREVKEMEEYVKNIRNSWAVTGCSVLLDGWVDERGRNLVNFIVESPAGAFYLRSADVSAIVDDMDALESLLDEVIEELGVDNVVQFVACSTTGWMGAVGKQFIKRRKTVFWTVSASHCIELMLEKIGNISHIRDALDKAKVITKFIYGHPEVLELMRTHTDCWDLVKSSNMKLAKPLLTLENMVSEKKNLKNMFTSSQWMTSTIASSPEGERVASLVGDVSFWCVAEMALKAAVPLLNVVRLIHADRQPYTAQIYEAMDQVKETIKKEFKNRYASYNPIWELIDEIWDGHLHCPLHAAGYFLNPSLFYSTDFHIDSEVAFGLLCCVVFLVQDQPTQNELTLQLDCYREGLGAFKYGKAADKISVSPGTNLTAQDIDPTDDWTVTESPSIAPENGDLERKDLESTNASNMEGHSGIQGLWDSDVYISNIIV